MKLNSTARKKVCKKQGAKRAGWQEPLLGGLRGRRAGELRGIDMVNRDRKMDRFEHGQSDIERE